MTIHAGDTITTAAYVESSPGVPSVSSPATVFSVVEAHAPDNSVLINPPIVTSLEAPGYYEISFVTLVAQPGTYELHATGAEQGDVYLETFVVDAAIAADLSGDVGISLWDMVIVIADDLADHIELTATAPSAGPNVMVDANNLLGGDGELRSSHGVVRQAADPANVGKVVRVQGNSSTTTSITFAPNLPSALVTGDIMDLVNLGGFGFRPEVYRQQIKNAVIKSYPDALIEISASSSPDRFDAASPTIPIPDEFVAVYGVFYMYQDDVLQWRDVRPARGRGGYATGWSLDRPSRTIRIDGDAWQDLMDGTLYVIGGYAKHGIPTADTDLVTVPAYWIILEVKGTLAGRRIADRRWNDWAVEWGRRADTEKMNIWTPRHADTQFLAG